MRTNRAKARRGNAGVWPAVYPPVEDVVELDSELDVHGLPDGGFLDQRPVLVVIGDVPQTGTVRRRVPERVRVIYSPSVLVEVNVDNAELAHSQDLQSVSK